MSFITLSLETMDDTAGGKTQREECQLCLHGLGILAVTVEAYISYITQVHNS